MNKTVLLFAVLSFSAARAQITLNTSDFPSANDIYVMSNATPFTGMDETLTGANFTWDYSGLDSTTTGQQVDTFFAVTTMNFIYQAVFGDFNFLPHRSNQATHGMDFSLGTQITITDVFNFFYNSSSDYHQTGFGAGINGIPAPTAYSPHDVLYKFPLQFGNADTSASGYSVSLPNFLYYGVNRNRVNEVDGWGSLTTPYGTFDVLRLKSTIHEHDSVYLDTLGFGYGFNLPEQIEYKWLGQGMGEPLLQVNVANGIVTSILYRDSLSTATLNDAENIQPDFILFPNPAADRLFIRYSLLHSGDVRFTVTGISGNLIAATQKEGQSFGDHIQVMDLPAGLPAGNYFLKMESGKGAITKPFVTGKGK